MNIHLGMAVSLCLFVLYWLLLSRLVDAILEAPRLKNIHWLLVGLFNAWVLVTVWAGFPQVLLPYGVMMALMLAEFVVFYWDSLSGALLCTLACAIHVAALFMIVLSTAALCTGQVPSAILASTDAVLWCCACTFLLLDMAIVAALRLVPLPKVKLINQHKEQQWFIIAWMAVGSLFLLYMASLLYSPGCPAGLSGAQIAASVAVLSGLYIILFFSIHTGMLLGYKAKNAELEQAIQQEQQYRAFMVRDAISSYEVNITQDVLLQGTERQFDDLEEGASSYTDALILLSQRLIYSEDIEDFVRNFGRTNLLRLYEKGQRECIAEYRRLLETGESIWVRSVVNLVQDGETGDIKAFVCVKNIDEEKRTQLDLQRQAERDPLTGLYNRSAASKLIDEYLAYEPNRTEAALFMIDVDNFKEINDHFGHLYGDAVLCELADKLVGIVGSRGIGARVGGDEFAVLLKDSNTLQKIETMAMAIRTAFLATSQGVGDASHNISSSIGISLFPRDGKNFKELYAHADIALYAAKSEGKNSYKIYDGSSFSAYVPQRTEIHALDNIAQKGFRENRIEYVFKMLYQSENPVAAIHAVLELVASHFAFERGYIFETSKDGKTSSNTFEWCAQGIASQIENLQNVPSAAVATAYSHFQRHGTFILKSLDDVRPIERAVLEPQGIKSMFQFGIFDKSRLLGFIGFDNCRNEEVPTDQDVDEIKTICNILATFFVKQYIDEVSQKDLLARQEVMNHLDNYIYVINTDTFQVLFMNKKIQTLIDSSQPDPPCYSFFRGKTAQCEDCPLRSLSLSHTERVVAEIYNDKLNIWMETSASLMRWTDGNLACLINCSDITKQKQDHLNYVDQLEKLIYVDTLTGGLTYHKFQIDAQRILKKQPEALHCLIKLDIANFKLINQIYGFEKGNEILCCAAKALRRTTRNAGEIFARVNNDEFIALFTIEDAAEMDALEQGFLDHFQQLVGSDFAFQCRFPHGRYLIEPGEATKMAVHDMFEKVNIAHKAAKLDKTLDYVFYDEQMTQEALRVRTIENRMADALANHEFSVYLQPKYYLKDETIGGAEALTRWKTENLDLFFPNTFIPVFEQNGFITKLDFYIFHQVCLTIRSWIDRDIQPVTISVNFSRLHLDNADFVQSLCHIADSAGVPRKYLEIEITETVIFDNIDTLEVLLNDIHKSGFSMSMDDFGSGYSSLGMLKDFPVDVIKMDRSFFADQRDPQRSKTVVGSVIQMAANLGIRIVAEGVEEEEHINFLRELHCDMVQGYYYAKPMPVDDFTELLQRERGLGI